MCSLTQSSASTPNLAPHISSLSAHISTSIVLSAKTLPGPHLKPLCSPDTPTPILPSTHNLLAAAHSSFFNISRSYASLSTWAKDDISGRQSRMDGQSQQWSGTQVPSSNLLTFVSQNRSLSCNLHSPTYSRNSGWIPVRFQNSMWILVRFWLDSGILGGFWVNPRWIPELYLQVQVHFLTVFYINKVIGFYLFIYMLIPNFPR